MNHKLIALILPAALLLGACSQNNATNPTASTPAATDLKGVASGIFDLPSSIADQNPSIQVSSSTGLAKISAGISTDSADVQGLEGYKYVPQYIHFADAVKDSVRALIIKFTAMNPPDSFSGNWSGFDVKLASRDTVILGDSLKAFWLTMSKDSMVVLHLQYLRNGRDQYRGACYYHTQTTDSTAFLLRFNNFNQGVLGSRMVLWMTRPATQLTSADDPNVIRIRAVRTPAGRVLISGVSLHPTFAGDGFWPAGPKVYGYQAVSDSASNEAVLRVAFADQKNVDSNFFSKYSLDQAVAIQAAQVLQDSMSSNAHLASLIAYSIDKGEAVDTLTGSNALAAYNYVSTTVTAANFSATDLDAYLNINANSILAGTDKGMKSLLFMVTVKQPIFLSRNATIVGYAGKIPTGFALDSSAISTENVSIENAVGLQDSLVTDALANSSDSI